MLYIAKINIIIPTNSLLIPVAVMAAKQRNKQDRRVKEFILPPGLKRAICKTCNT